jgi:hypothetical protein
MNVKKAKPHIVTPSLLHKEVDSKLNVINKTHDQKKRNNKKRGMTVLYDSWQKVLFSSTKI